MHGAGREPELEGKFQGHVEYEMCKTEVLFKDGQVIQGCINRGMV